jgi:hypothetical protein
VSWWSSRDCADWQVLSCVELTKLDLFASAGAKRLPNFTMDI